MARLLPEEQVEWVMYQMMSNMLNSQRNNTLKALGLLMFILPYFISPVGYNVGELHDRCMPQSVCMNLILEKSA